MCQKMTLGRYLVRLVTDGLFSAGVISIVFFQFGSVDSVSGTFGVKTGRVFVSYKEKEGALRAIQEMLVTRQFHLQVNFTLFLFLIGFQTNNQLKYLSLRPPSLIFIS